MYRVFFLIIFSFVFASSKQLYSTIQMMDQVMIIDAETLQIDQSISTEFNDNENSQDCMGYSEEVECNMAVECEWMMNMCMESMVQDDINTPHFIVFR